ncbi:MAG: terminase [Acidimicrobiaceae bacterium]|nr:terminase [Acidimicrobiaceae bacterium]|tara:strand:- start:4288 stop:5904 length:1617 start_codon:yes stop_codon:yes gene_type:complete
MSDQYLGNMLLKRADVQHNFTKEEVEEYVKCRDNIIYFLETHAKIVHVDKGLISFDLYPFQKDLIKTISENRNVIVKTGRQVGKSTTTLGWLLHYVLFNQSKTVGILANKAATARELLGRIQIAYQHLPKYLQQGLREWNKGSLELENGSKIIASSTSSSAIRGFSFSCILLDEFAHVQRHIADEFIRSVYPTISSGSETKIIIVSTPNGFNMFHKYWNDAVEGTNDFKPFKVHWSAVPNRTQVWKDKIESTIGEDAFRQEYEAEFLGSSNTLVSYEKLQELSYSSPIYRKSGVDVFEDVDRTHSYIITVDVARGQGYDYSAFTVFDITQIPYKIVAKYKDNLIAPLVFPNIINIIGKKYNDAYILIEVNDIGSQVSDVLHHDLEYENLFSTAWYGRHGQQLSGFVGGRRDSQFGVRTTKSMKKIGCSNLKALIEDDKLLIPDYDVISELSTFVSGGDTFAAEEGANDDLVMTLVLFAWLVDQQYFKELSNQNIRSNLYKNKLSEIEDLTTPFGIINNGINQEEYERDVEGTIWTNAK